MLEFLKSLSLNEEDLDSYINEKLNKLNSNSNCEEFSLSENDSNIYFNWINLNFIYLPSGIRSKGFKIDNTFFKELVLDIKEKTKMIPLDKIKNNISEDWLINWFYFYVKIYFGLEYDVERRKEIYGYGLLNSIGKTINISELKSLNVARCIEKSAALNAILNYFEIDSSLVFSYANKIGHSYCLIKKKEHYFIVDPNFNGRDNDGKAIPYIFEIDIKNDVFSFDPAEFGDISGSPKVEYDFPKNMLSEMKK